jgi:hypothetical protein
MSYILLIVFVVVWFEYSFAAAVGVFIAGLAFLLFLLLRNSGESTELPVEKTSGSIKKDRGFRVKAHLRITYTDSHDVTTTREIVALQYLDNSPGKIHAFCKLAKAHRTFITNRISDAVDLETGEVVKRLPTFFRAHRETPVADATPTRAKPPH